MISVAAPSAHRPRSGLHASRRAGKKRETAARSETYTHEAWSIADRAVRARHDAVCDIGGAGMRDNISLQEKPVIRRESSSPRNETDVFSTWKRRAPVSRHGSCHP